MIVLQHMSWADVKVIQTGLNQTGCDSSQFMLRFTTRCRTGSSISETFGGGVCGGGVAAIFIFKGQVALNQTRYKIVEPAKPETHQ